MAPGAASALGATRHPAWEALPGRVRAAGGVGRTTVTCAGSSVVVRHLMVRCRIMHHLMVRYGVPFNGALYNNAPFSGALYIQVKARARRAPSNLFLILLMKINLYLQCYLFIYLAGQIRPDKLRSKLSAL